jgi:hypothetical protein
LPWVAAIPPFVAHQVPINFKVIYWRHSDVQDPTLRSGHSIATDPQIAVAELHEAIAQPKAALMVFFCSSHFDLDTLAGEFNTRFQGTPVIGCTTAGEIGPAGYLSRTLSGFSIPARGFTASTACIDGLSEFDEPGAREATAGLLHAVDGRPEHSFAFLLADGMCGHEERLTFLLQRALGDVALVGGSAGDDERFADTHVFANGQFSTDRAVLTTVTTSRPFTVFRSSHFIAASDPLVVTEANPSIRQVREINGRPAVEEYARVAGLTPDQLDSAHFAAAPLAVRIDGSDYVRSVREANADGSLTLYCAIERGVVLRIAKGADMVASRAKLFDDIRQHIGKPQITLGFDCIHCQLEARRIDGNQAIGQLFVDNNVVGFSTYGEQFVGVHVNQTFTGVAIGRKKVS